MFCDKLNVDQMLIDTDLQARITQEVDLELSQK